MNDTGDYKVGNVKIILASENTREYQAWKAQVKHAAAQLLQAVQAQPILAV